MKREYVEAIELLASFNHGDEVIVTERGHQPLTMRITQAIHRSDGAYGSPESSRVKVSLGPGRYSTSVTADEIVHLGTTIAKA